jgi:hypothetical protein
MNRCSYVDDISGTAALEAVPFLLAAGALPDLPDGNSLQELFVRLREKCDLEPNQAYNMILYHHHMIVMYGAHQKHNLKSGTGVDPWSGCRTLEFQKHSRYSGCKIDPTIKSTT